jgi:hypothetical protein
MKRVVVKTLSIKADPHSHVGAETCILKLDTPRPCAALLKMSKTR